jgi:O-antigen/teichoic acid export membrane protein
VNTDLKQRTIKAMFWAFSERIGQQGIYFFITIILARLLEPKEFGLIAMLSIFMAVAQSIIDSGFGQALIQKQNADHMDECSIFYFNIFVGVVAAALLCLAAPWIAAFYNTSILAPITCAFSLNLIINAFGIVQTTLLTKRIDFQTQLKISLIATVLSGSIGVIMAYRGFGVWSLVAQSIASSLSRTSLLWLFHRWRPAWSFSFASLRNMFAFGSNLFFSGLLENVFLDIHLIVIGKIFSAADLGFYSRAKGLQGLVAKDISTSVCRVAFPVFSSIQDDKVRLKAGVRKALKTMAMLNFPLMVGLAIVAKPLVILLLTDKWLPCVPYLQLFCVIGALLPLQEINLNVLKAQGRSDLFFRLQLLKKVLVMIAIAITYRWGILAIIYGQIVTGLIDYWLNSFYTGRLIHYPITAQIVDLMPSLGLAAIMGMGIYTLQYVVVSGPAMLLTLQIIAGIALYGILCRTTQQVAFMDLIAMAKPTLMNLRRAI